MVLSSLLLASLAATPPVATQYWLLLDDVPVGTVALKLEGAAYTYASTHFFGDSPRAPAQGSYRGALDGRRSVEGRVPVSLFLWLRSSEQRCEDVFDEVTGKTGTACINDRLGDVDLGNALGNRYRATYREGVLWELELGEAKFVRGEGPPPPPPDVFALGIPVKGVEGKLAFTEELGPRRDYRPLRSTLWSRDRVEEAIAQARARLSPSDTAACVRLAEEVLHRVGSGSGQIVYGVVLDGARVYPHAWLRIRGSDDRDWLFDPGLDVEVKPTTHLELPTDEPGELYLRLWAGTLGVLRVPEVIDAAPPPPPDPDAPVPVPSLIRTE